MFLLLSESLETFQNRQKSDALRNQLHVFRQFSTKTTIRLRPSNDEFNKIAPLALILTKDLSDARKSLLDTHNKVFNDMILQKSDELQVHPLGYQPQKRDHQIREGQQVAWAIEHKLSRGIAKKTSLDKINNPHEVKKN
jgi:hypothetical protein